MPKIGFITKENPLDVNVFSGTHRSAFLALERHLGVVEALGPANIGSLLPWRIKAKAIATSQRFTNGFKAA